MSGGGANARADPPKWRSHQSEADNAEEGNQTKKRMPPPFLLVPVGGAEEIKTPECDGLPDRTEGAPRTKSVQHYADTTRKADAERSGGIECVGDDCPRLIGKIPQNISATARSAYQIVIVSGARTAGGGTAETEMSKPEILRRYYVAGMHFWAKRGPTKLD